MSNYERLTKTMDELINPLDTLIKCRDRLAELEDKIENGELAEVTHGKWKVMQTVVIRMEGRPKYSEAHQCSVCGKWNNKKQNFCPNCGAKMDLEEVD